MTITAMTSNTPRAADGTSVMRSELCRATVVVILAVSSDSGTPTIGNNRSVRR